MCVNVARGVKDNNVSSVEIDRVIGFMMRDVLAQRPITLVLMMINS